MSGNTLVKNGKTYTKVSAYPFVCRDEDGYFAYRLYNKSPKIDTFITKDRVTGEKFTSALKAYENRRERLNNLMAKCPEKAEDNTVDMIWNQMLESEKKSEGTIRKHTSVYTHHIKPVFGKTKLKDLTVSDINILLNKLYTEGDGMKGRERGYSYAFVESVLKWFYWFYNFCYSHDLFQKKSLTSF